MKKFFCYIFILLLISTTSYYVLKKINTHSGNENTPEAINVVREYFNCYNKETSDSEYKLITTEEQDPFNDFWGPPEYISLVSLEKIELETDPQYKAWYMRVLGERRGYKPNNIKVIKTKYKLKYKHNECDYGKDGEYLLRYFVVRKGLKEPWKIDYWIKELPLY